MKIIIILFIILNSCCPLVTSDTWYKCIKICKNIDGIEYLAVSGNSLSNSICNCENKVSVFIKNYKEK